MKNVIKFSLKQRASRTQAMNWLAQSGMSFPLMSESMSIGANIFYGWRFVLGIDGLVYFANCVEQGITEIDLLKHKEVAA